MTTTLKVAATLAIAAIATACDWQAAKERKEDRAEQSYKTAMADYSAGRIDAAVAGFEKTLKDNPGNSSARFQLASLLQDHRRDYLGAMCQYREYMLQNPSSDKTDLARERNAICERQYATFLLNQLKDGEGPVAKEIARLRAATESDAKEIARLKEELAQVTSERDSAKRDAELARKLVKSLGDDESTAAPKFDLKSARALLDEEDDEGIDRVKFSSDVSRLLSEEEDETTSAPFTEVAKSLAAEDEKESVTPPFEAPKPSTPATAPATAEAKGAETAGSAEPAQVADSKTSALKATEPKHEKRPDTYVVQDGDTLYKIAIRFYGKRSAWTRIRDANKAVISTDGRVNAGVKIKLPPE